MRAIYYWLRNRWELRGVCFFGNTILFGHNIHFVPLDAEQYACKCGAPISERSTACGLARLGEADGTSQLNLVTCLRCLRAMPSRELNW